LQEKGGMGQSESAVRVPTTIDVALERSEYFAGDVVKGYVEANVNKAIQCMGIFVELECEAVTVVQYIAPDGKFRRTEQSTDALHPTAIQVAPARKDRVVPGRYQIPFEFTLPKASPPTIEIKNQRYYYASTAFTIGIRFRSSKRTKDLLKRYRIRVFTKPKAPMRSLTQFSRQRFVSFCCLPRGSVEMTATFNKNACQQDELLNATFEIMNDSPFRVKMVEMYLKEFFEITANGQTSLDEFRGQKYQAEIDIEGDTTSRGDLEIPFKFAFPDCQSGTIRVTHCVIFKARLSNGKSLKVSAPIDCYGRHRDTYEWLQPTKKSAERKHSRPIRTKAKELHWESRKSQPMLSRRPSGCHLAAPESQQPPQEQEQRNFIPPPEADTVDEEDMIYIPRSDLLIAEPIDFIPDADIIETSSTLFTMDPPKRI